ncbi:exonuclease [Arthrobacter phage GoCrazy]|uniref:Exonuclease n=3 Tax=Mudcatvirus TaxID=1982088 RepID=A0A222ZJN4_9CAUD|nr:exonuclease [Arthrobacter phage Cheesy]YP_010666382.1 exonuclease [Arthrobacter phage Correa]YP_010666971.1 exonuclease [Arthrobacter phage KeaneyLin]QXO13589.1 exonuclease [Arthrobacter phage GoCrazy]ASR80151.1 exonuclease [Arthrobacter phage Correa]ASR84678.1 exonuclease [Arthrobacter phage Cheesy]AXH44231.1 exonuclease [Arthrobacter phage KeaneyLin]
MNFNTHSELAGRHAFLSASKYHWVNYDDEKLANSYRTALAAQKGTELHDLAAQLIKHKVKQRRSKQTLPNYVNDAIDYRMKPEVLLFASMNAFGTADAIGFRNNLLRIHDLKTGVLKADMRQLMIYAAFFCIEYGFKPGKIDMELRIYQNDEIEYCSTANAEDELVDNVAHIMDKIAHFDPQIDIFKEEAYA